MKTILKNNKIADILNLEVCKKMIKNCPKDEIVILISHYSINKPKYSNDECLNDCENEDFCELEQYFQTYLSVSDYDDLIADPHNIMNC